MKEGRKKVEGRKVGKQKRMECNEEKMDDKERKVRRKEGKRGRKKK